MGISYHADLAIVLYVNQGKSGESLPKFTNTDKTKVRGESWREIDGHHFVIFKRHFWPKAKDAAIDSFLHGHH